MKLPEIAVNLLVFNTVSLDDALDAVGKTDSRLVELAYTSGYAVFDEASAFTKEASDGIREALEIRGLRCRSIAAHMDLGMEDSIDRFRQRLLFAHRVGATIVISNTSTIDRRLRFEHNIIELSHIASDLGMTIGLENPGDGSGNLLSNGVAGAKLISSLGLANVGLNYDFSNAISYAGMKLDIELDCASAVEKSVNLHLKDLKSQESGLGWDFCPIGEGDHDYVVLFKHVKKHGVPIPMSLELPLHMQRGPDLLMKPRTHLLDREECIEAIQQSIQNINRLWETV
ncbi:sugar phosphate isomerase/epimerase family protein [Pleomorphochaeta sp. DL1XJH-081]|uniref:sugar phosphate isomerase/epimerase family protein n=1 Tax=Pleomorphochaeta sp. DL1XJH-081 TaxID=3409690 RepID=UPI003BB5D2D5